SFQKELVEEKQKEIVSSITYAKRLQDAILPPLKDIQQALPDSFVLYKPKDIVAGDFYWMEKVESPEMSDRREEGFSEPPALSAQLILIAAADCTGHGVPGAMVSVVCSNALNRTVKEFGIREPGKILDKVRELVIETFEKSADEVKDGMDISLCSIQRDSESGTSLVQWSGANNPLWLISKDKGAITELKPDKQPIGKVDQPKPFHTHRIELKKGDALYLFTDGYADQFGGPNGKKFKYKQMEQLITNNKDLDMAAQKKMLENAFEAWRANLEQVDDVCIIGVRL
ncbi:MAG: PP2C family protein-serine/threonine phosphatase, partial [Bacteroidia bacterium]